MKKQPHLIYISWCKSCIKYIIQQFILSSIIVSCWLTMLTHQHDDPPPVIVHPSNYRCKMTDPWLGCCVWSWPYLVNDVIQDPSHLVCKHQLRELPFWDSSGNTAKWLMFWLQEISWVFGQANWTNMASLFAHSPICELEPEAYSYP